MTSRLPLATGGESFPDQSDDRFPPNAVLATGAAQTWWHFASTKPAQIGSVLLVGGLMLWGPMAGGTESASITPVRQPAQLRYIAGWTSTATTVLSATSEDQAAPAPLAVPPSDPDSVKWLHAQSGLTWDQIGRIFGVSRRAVHMWANGGRMNAANAELLAELVAIVDSLPAASPAARRAVLLAAGAGGGRSIVDELRARQNQHLALTGPGFEPDQMVGALHDRPADTS